MSAGGGWLEWAPPEYHGALALLWSGFGPTYATVAGDTWAEVEPGLVILLREAARVSEVCSAHALVLRADILGRRRPVHCRGESVVLASGEEAQVVRVREHVIRLLHVALVAALFPGAVWVAARRGALAVQLGRAVAWVRPLEVARGQRPEETRVTICQRHGPRSWVGDVDERGADECDACAEERRP